MPRPLRAMTTVHHPALIQKKAERRMTLGFLGSGGGIRTHDQWITRALSVSRKRGLYLHPSRHMPDEDAGRFPHRRSSERYSFRIVSEPFRLRRTWLLITMLSRAKASSQFTPRSFRRFRRKLRNARVNLPMAVGAYQDASLDFLPHPFPGPRAAVLGDAEGLLARIEVVDVECPPAAVIAAEPASSTEFVDREFADLSASFRDCLLDSLRALGVCAGIFHTFSV